MKKSKFIKIVSFMLNKGEEIASINLSITYPKIKVGKGPWRVREEKRYVLLLAVSISYGWDRYSTHYDIQQAKRYFKRNYSYSRKYGRWIKEKIK